MSAAEGVLPDCPAPAGAPLDPLEIAFGRPLELLGTRVPRRTGPARRGLHPRVALERVVLRSLVDGAVTVSFSGGRDSSLVLAVACHVARREGLPLPVPVTLRHTSEGSQETEWQERVVAALGVPDWVRFDAGDSLDVLGGTATQALAGLGLLAPPNAYLHLGMLRAAPCRTVLTGVGGDELLSAPGARLPRVLWGREAARPPDALRVLLALAPRQVRRDRHRRTSVLDAPWLTPLARDLVRDRLADELAAVRARWDSDALMWVRSRTTTMFRSSLEAVAASVGARASSPLSDPGFVAAFAAYAGPAGPPGRTSSMRLLGGDLLPEAVLARQSKATFDSVVWGPRLREFARGWQPATLRRDVAALVEVERVRESWLADEPPYGTTLLAQRAWLDARDRVRPQAPG